MKIAMIGFGHMGSAIIAGGISAGAFLSGDVTVSDRFEANLNNAATLGVGTTQDNKKAADSADIVILAVKPNNLAEVAEDIRGAVSESAVIVSICAGKRLETMAELFGAAAKSVRVMPNTPALVGEGMTALCPNANVTDGELSAVKRIFESFGKAEVLPEELFDCVTAVSGSGPAYVYAFIGALQKYAQEAGMSAEAAKVFAAQTTLGAAKMALLSDESPETLKEKICTPGGTTVEAVKVLDERGFEETIIDAAKACAEKSNKLSRA